MFVLQTLTDLVDWRVLLGTVIVFVPLERLVPIRQQRVFRKGWTADGAYIFINSLIYRFSFILVAEILIFFGGIGSFSWSAAFLSKQPLWLQAVEAVLVGDFCLYWAHRALHANKLLWRFHVIHHSVEELDWAVAYHSHAVDELILNGAAFWSVWLLGFSPAAIGIYGAIYAGVSLTVHANINVTIGPLRRIVSSPEFHHWHHSNERDARDRNFAAIVSFWDFAFGTAFLPKGRMPQVYGTDANIPAAYVDQVFHPFRRETGALADGPTTPRYGDA